MWIAMDCHFKKEINLKSSLSLKKASNLVLLFFTICLLSLLDNCSSKNGHCPHEIFVKTPGWNSGNSCVAVVEFISKYDDIDSGYINSCKQYNNGTVYNKSDLHDILSNDQKGIIDKAKDMKIYLNFQIVNQMVSNDSTAVNYTILGIGFDKKVEMFQLRNNTWTTMDKLNNSIPINLVEELIDKQTANKLCAVYHKRIKFVNCKNNPFTHVVCTIPRIGECKIVKAEIGVQGCVYCKEGYLLPYCLSSDIVPLINTFLIQEKTAANGNAEQMYLLVGISTLAIAFLFIIISIYIRMKGEISLILQKKPSTALPTPEMAPIPESSQSLLSLNESARDIKDMNFNNKCEQKFDDKSEGRISDYMSTLKQFASIKLGVNYEK
ncbi:hypothetical protein T11_795 [Trichinella zimbabwensis]|uniref:Uncharacterized protein n=1 Tax=Trichinella zimbabwensis TaxID=268475 RepID=A0A0V1HCF2_9BILA|nr:hypothetical protein T11_795 [Trichinella zimbabwensis]